MSTAERLAKLIRDSRLSQRVIAERAGMTFKQLNNRVLGITPIKADEIPILAKALDASPADFFDEAPPAKPAPPQEGAPSYADVFAREVARLWQGEAMTDAEREFLAATIETLHRSIHRFRERLLEEELRQGDPSPRD